MNQIKKKLIIDGDTYIIKKSQKPEKKYSITFLNTTGRYKTIYFGDSKYGDFLQTKNKKQLKHYDSRHRIHEDWHNPHTSGFWAKYILWNEHATTIDEAIRQISNSFNINIINLI